MKGLAKIGIALATCILLLHSFAPHQHHGEFSEREHLLQHEQATSAFKKVILGFHVNLGEDHLNHFEPSDEGSEKLLADFQQLLPFVLALAQVVFALLFAYVVVPLPAERPPFYQTSFLSLASLRGPPVLA